MISLELKITCVCGGVACQKYGLKGAELRCSKCGQLLGLGEFYPVKEPEYKEAK